MNFRDLVEVFPMFYEQGEDMAHHAERLEEASYAGMKGDLDAVHRKFDRDATMQRMNFQDMNRGKKKSLPWSSSRLKQRLAMQLFVFESMFCEASCWSVRRDIVFDSSFENIFLEDVYVLGEHMRLSFKQLVARVICVPTNFGRVKFYVRGDGSFYFGTSFWDAKPYLLSSESGLGMPSDGNEVDIWNFYCHWRREVHSVLSLACAPSLLVARIMETRSWSHMYLVDEILSNQPELNLCARKLEYTHPKCLIRDDVTEVVNECCGELLRYFQENVDSVDFSLTEWSQLYDICLCVRKDFGSHSRDVREVFRVLNENMPWDEHIDCHLRNVFTVCATQPPQSVGDDLLAHICLFLDDFNPGMLQSRGELLDLLKVCCFESSL